MKRKFIAGAVCPSCGKQDKIVLLADRGGKVMECVSCGYKKVQGAEVQDGKIKTTETENAKHKKTDNDKAQTITWK